MRRDVSLLLPGVHAPESTESKVDQPQPRPRSNGKEHSLSKLTSSAQDAVIELQHVVLSREVFLLLVELETERRRERLRELDRVFLEFESRSVEDEMREGSAVRSEDTRVRDESFVGVIRNDGETREDVDWRRGEGRGGRRRAVVSFSFFREQVVGGKGFEIGRVYTNDGWHA